MVISKEVYFFRMIKKWFFAMRIWESIKNEPQNNFDKNQSK